MCAISVRRRFPFSWDGSTVILITEKGAFEPDARFSIEMGKRWEKENEAWRNRHEEALSEI